MVLTAIDAKMLQLVGVFTEKYIMLFYQLEMKWSAAIELYS